MAVSMSLTETQSGLKLLLVWGTARHLGSSFRATTNEFSFLMTYFWLKWRVLSLVFSLVFFVFVFLSRTCWEQSLHIVHLHQLLNIEEIACCFSLHFLFCKSAYMQNSVLASMYKLMRTRQSSWFQETQTFSKESSLPQKREATDAGLWEQCGGSASDAVKAEVIADCWLFFWQNNCCFGFGSYSQWQFLSCFLWLRLCI